QSLYFGLDENNEHRENLEELLDEVYETGEILVESQSLENIKRYRRAVRSFLDYVVSNMIAVEEQTSGSNILRRKRFTQVKIIDGRLERLAAQVLQNQGKQLDILEKINEIRGLLVDLIT
ncbi:MAG: YaaR family protein, partial [Spirochaetales bacterium]|nr:YaaR family protein [Spirochaetales bacterium]